MIAASIARVPSALHEQNAVLGRVNRLLAPRVARIAATFPFARFSPADQQRIVFTGNPVRATAADLRARPYVPPRATGDISLLVFGGSQGARALSELVPAALLHLPRQLRDRICVTQQARVEDLDMVNAAYRGAGVRYETAVFFSDLPERMAAAHLVIARSGASTLSELTVIGRPAILIPYPFAMDNHQAANAAVLEKAGAAWVVAQSGVDAGKLSILLASILGDPAELAKRAAAAKALGHPDAAKRLADLAEQLAEQHR
jgi:UDP-N-acetylglucosamine--N-acetylmuramyl-(pentapeptide) pyrophosphoryl-undecaprenol N-acetylglucosamine transferase